MRAFLPALAFLATVPAIAQAPALPGAPETARVTAGTYKVEPNHTQVGFAVDHFGFSIFRGFFSNASGTLNLDTKNLGATKLNITIPIDSIYTTSRELNGELIGPKFFDVQHWPNATFTSTSVLPGPDGKVLLNGTLTLHGQTRPVHMTVKLHGTGKSLMGKGQSIGFDARTAINRSEFGIGGGVPLVSDQVQITIAAAFEQQ
ncbi:YceI family protein [Sphingomonas oryzagri]